MSERLEGVCGGVKLVCWLFYSNYPGGLGLMAGAVFGRIAGAQAAGYAVG